MRSRFSGGLLALLFSLGLLGSGAGAVSARDDREYFEQLERESRRRAAEEQYIDRMREGWRQRARERALMRQQRTPHVTRDTTPSDRLGSKLHPGIPPFGHIDPGASNAADVHRRDFAPSRQRIVPRSLREFQRRDSR